jgi:2-methylcitrate dehydratase
MEKTTQELVDFSHKVRYNQLLPSTITACKIALIDTMGCAIGAYSSPLSVLTRKFSSRYSCVNSASMIGSSQKVSVEMAAFANGVMLRFLDLSDSYRVKSGGHPSDVISGILSVAESNKCSGQETIEAIVVAYEIYCAFCESIDINSKGWDQPVYGVLATTIAIGKLLKLNHEQMGHAVALSLAPNMSLHQTRRGELSHWKGCAAANGARNAVFAAYLAKEGFTGPTSIFEGRAGIWDVVGKFEFPNLNDQPKRIEKTHLKSFPVNYHGQSAVWAALDLRQRVELNDIKSIHIEGYHSAFEEMGSHPAHWAPKTHETADHSMPYVVATALMNGDIDESSFSEFELNRSEKLKLMQKITVREDITLTDLFPVSAPCRMKVTKIDGTFIESYINSPKGHADNPFSLEDVKNKFKNLSAKFCGEQQANQIIDMLLNIDQLKDVSQLFDHLSQINHS